MLESLPIRLTQVKAGKTSENSIKKDIPTIFFYIEQKKLPKKYTRI